jgi:hypothetical protein
VGGRGRWLPWLPETAVAATDDARGVTDSWQSYRTHQHTRAGCARVRVKLIRDTRTGTCEGGVPRHYKHALRDTACEVPFRSIAAAKPTLRS